MNPHFSAPKTQWFPEALLGKISTVEPTLESTVEPSLQVIFEGGYWRGMFLHPVAQSPQPGQTCQVIGRRGLTLLIQLVDSAIAT